MSLSPSIRQQNQGPFSPLLELPFELRTMVYREILTPDGCDGIFDPEEPDKFEQRTTENKVYAIAVKDSKDRANLFATSKQVNAEASEVWYNTHFFKATISSHMRIDGESERSGSIMLMPTYLPKIRNLEIYLDAGLLEVDDPPDLRRDPITKNLTRFCHELATHCHELRNVIVEVSCVCHISKHRMKTLVHPLWPPLPGFERSCLQAKDSEGLLMPLGRIRVPGNIQLKSSCKSLAESHQPIFDWLTAKIKSSDPVDELGHNEESWWKLKERAEPFLKDNAKLRQDLYDLHETADIHRSMRFWPGWHNERGWQHAFNTNALLIERRIDSLQASRNGGL